VDRRGGTLQVPPLRVSVTGEPLGHPRDLLLLLFDEDAQLLDRLPPVRRGDAAAVAVVAAAAGGDEVRRFPEQLRRLELGTRWWTVVA
jgi:hypothetical protein